MQAQTIYIVDIYVFYAAHDSRLTPLDSSHDSKEKFLVVIAADLKVNG